MKKQKRLSTIIASVAMIAVTAVALGTATFAWFTQGTTASAGGFDFTAQAAAGIQISTDATPGSWKSNITSADFAVQGESARTSMEGLVPVSTNTTVTSDGDFRFYTANYADDSYTISASTDQFLVFDLYFMNAGDKPLTLRLDKSSYVRDAESNDKQTSLATRVGFITQGSFTQSNSDGAAGVKGDSSSKSLVWEPNSTTRAQSTMAYGATNHAKYTYKGVHGDNSGAPIDSGTGAVDKYGTLTSTTYTTEINTTEDFEFGDPCVVTELKESEITKIKVFIWLEGQDIDNNNATSGGKVNINLSFDAASQETPALTVGTVTDATLSTVGEAHPGAVYTAYVLKNGTDAGFTYKEIVAKGSQLTGNSITLDEAPSGDYDSIVICGVFEGLKVARTES